MSENKSKKVLIQATLLSFEIYVALFICIYTFFYTNGIFDYILFKRLIEIEKFFLPVMISFSVLYPILEGSYQYLEKKLKDRKYVRISSIIRNVQVIVLILGLIPFFVAITKFKDLHTGIVLTVFFVNCVRFIPKNKILNELVSESVFAAIRLALLYLLPVLELGNFVFLYLGISAMIAFPINYYLIQKNGKYEIS